MFERLLSRVGIGAPSIELLLHDAEVIRGETLFGEIRVVGGRSAQEIRHIDLSLQTHYLHHANEHHSHTETLRQSRASEGFRLGVRETRLLPFEMVIPMVTPVSLDLAQVWIKAELDLAWAVDHQDFEPLKVLPDAATAHLLNTARELGFEHRPESGCCMAFSEEPDVPYTQVFMLEAKGRIGFRLRKQLQTVDMLVRANNYDAEIQLEINRQGPQVSGWLPEHSRMNGNRLRFRLRHNEPFPDGGLEELLLRIVRNGTQNV